MKRGMIANVGFFWDDENVLKVVVAMVAQPCELKTTELYILNGWIDGMWIVSQ